MFVVWPGGFIVAVNGETTCKLKFNVIVPLLTIVIVNVVYEYATDGVPAITPVDAVNVNPVGSVPDVIEYVYVPVFNGSNYKNTENMYLFWFEDESVLTETNLSGSTTGNTFFMTAKFYNAKNGFFTKMMNMPQSSISGDKFNFDSSQYFYYRVKMDYDHQTYQVFNTFDQRVGTDIPIKWFEYVNP